MIGTTLKLNEKKLLQIGILMFTSGILCNFFLGFNSNYSHPQVNLIQKLTNMPIIIGIIFLVIIAPFIEELIFRYWTTRKKHSIILSFFGISIFFFFYTHSVYLTLFVALFLAYPFFYFLRHRDKPKLTMVATSVVFALVHFENPVITMESIAMFASLFGFAIILSYLGLRKKFYYCIITHGAYNLLALILILFPVNTDALMLNSESFNASIKIKTLFTTKENNIITSDTIRLVGNLAELAASLPVYSNDTIYESNAKNFARYELYANSKNGKHINEIILHKKLVESMRIQTDTSYVSATAIRINNFDLLMSKEPPKMRTSLYSFIEQLREMYGLPFTLEELYYDRVIMVDLACLRQKNISDLSSFLKTNYDIDIYEANNKHITVIRFTY